MGWSTASYTVPAGSVEPLLAARHFDVLACCLRDGGRVFETYWTTGRGNEPMAASYGLMDMTVHGRREVGKDSPAGWPQPLGTHGQQFSVDGRPTAQWSGLEAGRSDDLGSS